MKKKLCIPLIVALLISLIACGNDGIGDDETQGSSTSATAGSTTSTDSSSTATSESVTESTQETITEIPTETVTEAHKETVTEASAEPPRDPRLVELEFLFSFGGLNWYNLALTSFYDSPEKINLKKLFHNGVLDTGGVQLTKEEKELVIQNLPGYEPYMELVVLPAEEMDRVLEQYFGITLSDCHPEDFGMYYLESKSSWVLYASDLEACFNLVFESLEERSDGSIAIDYIGDGRKCTVVILKVGYNFRIISNIPR